MTEDQDPTGMRHLLASLKESGPMPADLNKRITESLADEEAARQAPSDTADVDGDGGASDTDDTPFWRTMGDAGPRGTRRPKAPWILGAAAATVVALGVGGLMINRLDGGGDTASDAAPTQSAKQSAGSSETAGDAASPDDEVPAFVITASGQDYSEATVSDGASQLLDNPTEFPENTNDRALGTLTTAAGASDCLARLGAPQMQAVVVDVAKFDGEDGLLIVAQSLPDGPAKAWAITSGCEPIWPDAVDLTEQ